MKHSVYNVSVVKNVHGDVDDDIRFTDGKMC